MNDITSKAVRFEILETKASKILPAGYIVGNINTGEIRSGDIYVSSKTIKDIASILCDEIIRCKKGDNNEESSNIR